MAQGPDPLPSTRPWKVSTAAKELKQDAGIHHRKCDGKYQRRGSKTKSCCFFGLEACSELKWEDWDLEKEFTKTLVLKNTHNKLQKLHIRPPVSKFFSAMIPEKLVLNPGTSISIPVTFKPLQRREYEDSIEFHGKASKFQVFLYAAIPCHALEVPDSVMLPLCAVQHSTHASFVLKNTSQLHTYYQWECAGAFQLSPEHGLLKPGEECPITVVFRPQEALVHRQLAYCRFGKEAEKVDNGCTVLLRAQAKYPYLELRNSSSKDEKEHNTSVLNFGSVAVGQSLGKYLDIFNPSPVAASFSLTRLSGGVPLFGSVFCCDVTEGEMRPGESLRITFIFSPAVVDTVSVEYLTLKCSGACSEPRLRLTGHCIGPKVSLSSSVVDFGCIEENGSVVKTVKLVNSSAAEAIYQWDIDCSGNSVFSIQPASGTVLPHSHCTMKVVYRPTQPNAHHRRVACLILYKDSVIIDLIGTCHSEVQQPVILKPEHLPLFKLHWPHRKHLPDTSSAPQQDHNMNLDQQGVCSPLKELMSDGPAEMSHIEELDCMDPVLASLSSPPVSVVPTELLFNHKTTTSVSTPSAFSQSVSITNHTKEQLSLVWTLNKDSPFSISPSSSHLAPLKSTSFRVSYDPKQLNTLHGAQLECFAYCKEHVDISKRRLYPFWCLTVRVIGDSFQPGKEHFIPRCSLKPPQVEFPAISAIPYQTVLLKNEGHLPLTFCLDHYSIPALMESMFVVPSCGLMEPGDHRILALSSTPMEDSPTQRFNLQLQLNGADFTKELTVVSGVEKPCVSLEGGTTLYFQPTAVGSQTQCSHNIRNLDRLPVRFEWSISEPDRRIIFVEPHAGELHPNEISVQTWSFSPLENKSYTLKPVLYCWPLQSDGSNKSHLSLTVVGTGSKGFIEAEKAVLDVGEILVGSHRLIEVPLVNNSPCPVSFCLSVEQILLSDDVIHNPEAEPSALHLDHDRGTIASQSTMQLRCTVRPHRRTQCLWRISYQTTSANGFVLSLPQTLCEVQAKGVFPTLQVTDGWSSGSLGMLSKLRLWKLFSLDSFNEHLLSNPSSVELTFKTPTMHSLSNCPSIFTETMLDFHFSSAPLHSEPASVVLMLHNPGSFPVDWTFLFPKDQQIELEYWAVTGKFSSTELYQMKVQDNQLFSISPRSGTLLPGQKRAVHFSYSHDFAGTDQFPIVFKLSYGREILLNFQGVTVERDQPYLHFASNQHSFTSVHIGDCSPPRQVYEMHNGGAVPVQYEVDTAVLSLLQNDNYNHPVLCCVNPEGVVAPGRTALLEFVFSPAEAKMYQMDVPIHVLGGDSTLVRFEGCGLGTSTSASSNSLKHSDSKTLIPSNRAPFPGQALFLSEDSILLGDIPVNSRASRIVFLTNVSYTDSVRFQWDLQQQSNQQVVQIHPDRGRLCPKECALCVLTFTSSDYPAVYQLDLICQVFLEDALTQYHHDLQCWEEERERQQNELMITDKNTTESQTIFIDEEHLSAPSRKGPPLKKYKTLPPICASSSCETLGSLYPKLTKADRQLRREKAKVWRRPEPPRATLLHLDVSAHSHKIQQYRTLFPDQSDKHYRCCQFKIPAGPLTPSCVPEKDLVAQLLTSLLRDILDDSTFVEHLFTLPSTPNIHQVSSPLPSSPCPAACPTSSSPPPSQPQLPFAGKADGEDTRRSEHIGAQTRKIQYAPADICEDVLMNTIQNLMMEAVTGEFVFTTDPSNINMPPVSIRSRKEVFGGEVSKDIKEASDT